MTRAVGVVCKREELLLAVVVDGKVVDDPAHERIKAAQLLDATERLDGMLDDVRGTLTEVSPNAVRVLLPESNYKATYAELAPRAALETVVQLACLGASIPIERLSRPTVRSRLDLPRRGSLKDHVATVVPEPVGRYWRGDGRGLAALAALAQDDS